MFAYINGPYPYRTVLLFALLFGICAGLFYECFRILRTAGSILFPITGKLFAILCHVLVGMLDLLFFGSLGIAGVLFLYVCNRGQLRLSILLMMALGFAAYLLILGKWILRLHRAILRAVYGILRFVYRHTLYHLFRLLRFLYAKSIGKLFDKITALCEKSLQKMLLRHRLRRLDRLMDAAENGFAGMEDHISLQ